MNSFVLVSSKSLEEVGKEKSGCIKYILLDRMHVKAMLKKNGLLAKNMLEEHLKVKKF